MSSKTSLYSHSDAKVRLLREYMSAYLGILSNTSWIHEVYLYDLFSGPGIYENDGKGSPIVFLEEIVKAHETINKPRNRNTTFKCHFNDNDAAKIDVLKGNIDRLNLNLPDIGKVTYSTLDYKMILNSVKQQVSGFNNERAFIFIDPYGYNDIELLDIRDLMVPGKSEVLLFMPTHHMYRFKDNGTPECLVKFLDDLKITSKARNTNGLEFINLINEGFQNELGTNFYVDSFVIERETNQFFCLFFFTSNLLGYTKMLEAKWKIDKEQGRGWQDNAELNLFTSSESAANTLKLRSLIINYLKTGEKTNGQIFEFVIRNRFLPKHGTEVLKSLGDLIVVTNFNNTSHRKGAFYISFGNFKENPDRIKIRLR